MLRHLKQHWRSWLIAFLCVAFACGIVFFSDAFQQCMNKSYYESSDYEPDKGIALILSTLGWTKTCAGSFFKEDGEAITATFTVVLAVSTILLWRVTWKTGERQSADMRAMADIAEKQMLIVGAQTDIQKKQHAIGRLQFLADKRPRLFVRHISVAIPLAVDPEFITGTLVVVNQGGTEARIVDTRCRIYWDSVGLPMLPPLNDDKSLPFHDPNDGPIEEGSSRIYPIRATQLLIESYRFNINARGIKLYVMGFVRYADLNDKQRYMGFCREYEPPIVTGGNSRFNFITNKDYEYED